MLLFSQLACITRPTYDWEGLHMKARLVVGLCILAVLTGLLAATGLASQITNPVKAHRHFINGNEVGPNLCDNPDNPGIQKAFQQFHANVHRGAPGLHDHHDPNIGFKPC